MIIDQLPALASPQAADELPIERGITVYKIAYEDLTQPLQDQIDVIDTDFDDLKTSIIQSSAYAVTGNGTTSHSLTGLTADHVVGNWGMYSDSGLTTPIPENAPTCDIEITTSSGSWSITVANFTASFYIAPTFIKD